MEVTSRAAPGRRFSGKVASVDAIMNADTRTLRVRAEVADPAGLLKPEMYVDAAIHVDLGRRLAVPDADVIDTGERKIVYASLGGGKYAPREITVGREAEGYDEVLEGLSEGDMVAASANFLIDSESKLKAAVSQAGQ